MSDIDHSNEEETLGTDKSNEEGVQRSGEQLSTTEKKRKTVSVFNGAERALMLHRHETIPDDGGGRAFQGRSLPEAVHLKAGHNPRIDKEFFDGWLKQNKAFAEQCKIIAQDEDEPETESAEREEHD